MLKDLITGSHQLIEYKGKEPVRVRSFVRVHVTSNNEWVVPAGREERRFSVLDIGERRLQDVPYFLKIRSEMASGGNAALLDYLLTRDLSDVPLHRVLTTEALRDQKIASMRPEMLWWLDILMAGELPGDRLADGTAPTDLLYDAYLEHAKKRSERGRLMSKDQLGTFLHRVAPGVLRNKEKTPNPATGKRGYVYEFPALQQCRMMFDMDSRLDHDWPKGSLRWGDTS
jgi:hypothetical protein